MGFNQFKFVNVSIINDQLFNDDSSSSITRLPLPMAMACQKFVFEYNQLVQWKLEYPEKPLQAKPRADHKFLNFVVAIVDKFLIYQFF